MIKYPLQYESKRSYFDGEISEYFVVKDNDGQQIGFIKSQIKKGE